jgi:hypothetical protein
MSRHTRAAAAALALTLALPASALAQTQDLRNADRRVPAPSPGPTQDLRNADRRAPAHLPAPEPTQDLRNADRRAPAPSSGVTPSPVPAIRIVAEPRNGFDWGDAGIGAAGGIAIVTLAGATFALTAQRRRSSRLAVAGR